MSSRGQADVVIEGMRGLTWFERSIGRSRLNLYFEGRMPLWDKQVQRMGIKSVAYVWVANTWTILGGVSVLCANALFFFPHKPDGLLYLQWVLFAIFIVGMTMYPVRRVQSLRASKKGQTK